MEEAAAGLNWIEIWTQSISWEKGRKVGLGVIMTGMEPTAKQSVRWVMGLEGRVTRQKVALPSMRRYLGISGGIESSRWDGDLDKIFCRDGSSICV